MSEMLGNQYFLARKYKLAAKELQEALRKDSQNKAIRKKLIICYNQTGEIDRALEIFLSLVKEDIQYIIETDPIIDDCPCPEIVFNLEKELSNNLSSKDFYSMLAMLWLYCDVKKSIEYFQKVLQIDPDDPIIKSILVFLQAWAGKDRNNPSE